MEKDLLEVECQHLRNVVKECDPKQIEELEKKFALTYTYDAVGMVEKNRISYEDVKRLSQAKALLEYSEREQKEILNHLKAFDYVLKEVKENKKNDDDNCEDVITNGTWTEETVIISGTPREVISIDEATLYLKYSAFGIDITLKYSRQ